MNTVFLSVIIPTYQRNDLLILCLDKLAPGIQTLSRDLYEVIVTDDGRESTAEKLIKTKYSWVKWVQGSRRGPAANRNNGANNAKGQWFVFTDDDCLPHFNWLEKFYNAINSNKNIKSWEGAVYPTDWNELQKDMAECPVNVSGGCFWSANVAIERSVFESVRGFDENYKLAAQEDQDIYIQLKKQTSIPFLADCVVEHPVRTIKLVRKLKGIRESAESWLYYMVKNRTYLGCTSNLSILKIGYISQFVDLKSNVSKFYLRKAFISVCWLFYGIPFIFFLMLKNHNELK